MYGLACTRALLPLFLRPVLLDVPPSSRILSTSVPLVDVFSAPTTTDCVDCWYPKLISDFKRFVIDRGGSPGFDDLNGSNTFSPAFFRARTDFRSSSGSSFSLTRLAGLIDFLDVLRTNAPNLFNTERDARSTELITRFGYMINLNRLAIR
jgi:hypothetical protein